MQECKTVMPQVSSVPADILVVAAPKRKPAEPVAPQPFVLEQALVGCTKAAAVAGNTELEVVQEIECTMGLALIIDINTCF